MVDYTVPGHLPQSKRTWSRQMTWNSKMRTLLKGEGGVTAHEAPDYSPKAMSKWIVSQSRTGVGLKSQPNLWWRETYALLQKEPKTMRGFSFIPKGEVS